MSVLSENEAAALAGQDVRTVEDARQVDEVGADDVRAAQQAADEADRAAADLEHAALYDATAPPGEVLAAREASRFARLRAAVTVRRAQRYRQAQRLLALDVLGADIDELAAADNAGAAKAAVKIAEGAAELRAWAAQHDQRVAGLAARAHELGVEPPAPSGPRGSSAHVAQSPEGLRHALVSVQRISRLADRAVDQAAAGDPDGAVALLATSKRYDEPKQLGAYFRSVNGLVIGLDEPFSDAMKYQIRQGTLVPLTDDETTLYLEGRLG